MSTLAELENALSKIKAGKVPPLILVYGDQDYLVKQAYDRLLLALVPEDLRTFNVEQLDGQRAEPRAILDAFNIMPMMPGPKAVGVPEARFFQSKINGMDLLARAKEAWERQDVNAALRGLGRVLALLDLNWEEAQGRDAKRFAHDLEDESTGGALEGEWLAKALEQGLASAFPLPSAADESGEILAGLEESMGPGREGNTASLLFAASGADARKKLFRFIQERGLILEFKAEKRGPQASQTAAVFLRNLLSQRGLKMGSALAQRLVAAYGGDLGLLEKELFKLEAHAHPSKDIQEADFEAVGSPHAEDSIFRLFELLGKRQEGLGQALPLLRSLLAHEPAFMVFAQLCNEVRLLLLCKALLEEGKVPSRGMGEFYQYKSTVHPKLCQELPSGLSARFKRLNPWPAYQAFQRCRQFSQGQLKDILKRLLEADLRMKSSRGEPGREMEEICLRLCGIQETVVV